MHDNAPRIRPADLRDLNVLVMLLEELFAIEEDFTPNPAAQKQGLELLLASPTARILVAESGGVVAGMCSCQLVISTAEGALSGLVEDVVVAKPWRGRSIGLLLMESISRWATSNGATRLQLLADRNNAPALEFYARQGWLQTQLVCLRKTGLDASARLSTRLESPRSRSCRH